MKKLTFLSVEQIEALECSLKEEPHKRAAQRALAEEVVRDLHGQEALDTALNITNALFRGQLDELDESQRKDAVKDMEKIDCATGLMLEEVLVNCSIASSKREAREWIKGNSISINGTKVKDPRTVITKADAYVDNNVIVRRGKKRYYCVTLNEE